jgi:hypothetical protein
MRCPRFCWSNGDFGGILCDSCANSIEFSLTSNGSRSQLENRYVQDGDDASDDPNPALGIGLLVRSRLLKYAEKLQRPATLLSAIRSLVVFALIISLQYRTLAEIRLVGFVGISVMVLLCPAAGWVFAGHAIGMRKAVGLTTAARNVGVALLIATASFPDSAAVTAVIFFLRSSKWLDAC